MLGKIKIVVYLVQDNGLKIVQKMMIKFEFIYNIEKKKKKTSNMLFSEHCFFVG
jgi:hypothetical protein